MIQSILAAPPAHMLLGEGLLLPNVDLDACLASADPRAALAEEAASGHLLGATREGCIFRCTRSWLHTEARGKRTPASFSLLPGPWQISILGELTGVTIRNIARLLHASSITTGSLTHLAHINPIPPACMDTLLWAGESADGLLLVELTAPFSDGGLQLQSRPEAPGSMAFSFTACHTGADQTFPPCRILFLQDVPA